MGDGTARRIGPSEALGLLLLAALGIALRAMEAGKSLWLDELHTLDLASCPTLAELNALLAEDVHTPLYYVAAHLAYGLLPPESMRWLSIAASVLTLAPLVALARAAGLGPAARLTVAGLWAALPFQVQWGAELRPYAWLELFAVLAAWAAFSPARDRAGKLGRGLAFAAAVALGLYTHAFAALAVIAIGAAKLAVRARPSLGLAALVGWGALGLASFLPWVFATHDWLRRGELDVLFRNEKAEAAAADPEAEPIVDDTPREGAPWSKLAQVPAQTLVPRMGSLGGTAATLARAGFAGLALVLAVLLGACARRGRSALPEPPLAGALCTALAAAPLTALACIALVNRVPLQYFTLCAWGWPLLAGALVHGAAPALRGVGAVALVGAAALAGLGQALGAPREDLRAGVALAMQLAEERGAWLTAILWQPNAYAQATPFWVYGGDAPWIEPDAVPAVDAPGGERPVVVVTRSAPDEGQTNWDKWAPIRDGRVRESVRELDDSVAVYVYVLHPYGYRDPR